MTNPFEQIEARLQGIENLIIDLKQQKTESAPTDAPDELLTVKQAAELLSLAVPTIYTKVSKGELPVMKGSKRLYFSRTELIDYIRQCKRKTNEDINNAAENYLKGKR